MANLEFVEEHKSDIGPFEVTQLLNSFLGALAHPWENLKEELNSISLVDAERDGWPRAQCKRATGRPPRSLGFATGSHTATSHSIRAATARSPHCE